MFDTQFADSLPKEMDELCELGYTRSDESTTDDVRWVFYKKRLSSFAWGDYSKRDDVSYEMEITIRCQLWISDDPFVKTADNFEHSFNDCYINIYCVDEVEEDSVTPHLVAELPIHPRTLSELESFCTTMGYR